MPHIRIQPPGPSVSAVHGHPKAFLRGEVMGHPQTPTRLGRCALGCAGSLSIDLAQRFSCAFFHQRSWGVLGYGPSGQQMWCGPDLAKANPWNGSKNEDPLKDHSRGDSSIKHRRILVIAFSSYNVREMDRNGRDHLEQLHFPNRRSCRLILKYGLSQ